MERCRKPHEDQLEKSHAVPTDGNRDVDFLGRACAKGRVALHSETESPRPSGPVTTANVLRLLAWQKYRCALTGRTLTPETASLDHIVPVRSGGEHRIENTQVLHKDVNKAKTTMTSAKFIQLCVEVVRYAANHAQQGETS